MIQRCVIDLSEARDNEERFVKYWEYMYIGKCDGDVSLRFNSKRNCDLNPEEFSKIVNLDGVHTLLITNTAQAGKELIMYFSEKQKGMFISWI